MESYTIIIGLNEESLTVDLLGGTQSFVNKMGAVERVLVNNSNRRPKQKRSDWEKEVALNRELFTKARSINKYRNYLMHGIYGPGLDKRDLYLVTSLLDPRSKAAVETKLNPKTSMQ